jgi:hypothetical protein
MGVNKICFAASDGKNADFPCNADSIIAVSAGIGCGVLSLIFVFFLTRKVRATTIDIDALCNGRMQRLFRLNWDNLSLTVLNFILFVACKRFS